MIPNPHEIEWAAYDCAVAVAAFRYGDNPYQLAPPDGYPPPVMEDQVLVMSERINGRVVSWSRMVAVRFPSGALYWVSIFRD
jgi:hypothetical protein